MDKEWLTQQVIDGSSIADIAKLTNKGKATVRHWLSKYGLKTSGKSGQKALTNIIDGKKECCKCKQIKSVSEFYVRTDRGIPFPDCIDCNRETTNKKKHAIKDFAIMYKGGKCSVCDVKYTRNNYAFHHTEPEHKDFSVGDRNGISIPELTRELDKCVLVCHNCHSEVHHELTLKNGYTNKIKGNSERWVLSKKVHLNWAGRHSCDKCGYDRYEGALSIIFPDKRERINTIHIKDDEYGKVLKQSTILCINCLREDQ